MWRFFSWPEVKDEVGEEVEEDNQLSVSGSYPNQLSDAAVDILSDPQSEYFSSYTVVENFICRKFLSFNQFSISGLNQSSDAAVDILSDAGADVFKINAQRVKRFNIWLKSKTDTDGLNCNGQEVSLYSWNFVRRWETSDTTQNQFVQ